MVDATTLIVISTVAQTVVITITLVIFVLQFRSQEAAIKEASYQGLMGRYNDFISTMVEKPELAKFLVDQQQQGTVSAEEATVYASLLVAYGILEEAFLLHAKKWIDEDTWMQWSAWLVVMCKNPQFRQIHDRTSGTFDSRFHDYVDKILRDNEKANTTTKQS